MTLIDNSDVKLWYSGRDKVGCENLFTNLVLNKDEDGDKCDRTYDLLMLLNDSVILSPDLFINSQIKQAWRKLYSNQYEGNLSLLIQQVEYDLSLGNSSNVDPHLMRGLYKLLGLKSFKSSIELNKLINFTDSLSISDIHVLLENELAIKFVQNFLLDRNKG